MPRDLVAVTARMTSPPTMLSIAGYARKLGPPSVSRKEGRPMESLDTSIPLAERLELRRRILDTRWPDAIADDWERGTRPSALRHLLERWADDAGAGLARRTADQEHLLVPTSDGRVHVRRAGSPGAPALMLVHGWPDSFLRYERLVPLLADQFDLVIPSVPGYGYSDRPAHGGTASAWTAERFAETMEALGIERYGVHGGDIGTGICEQLALAHPDRLTGLHLSDIPIGRARSADPAELSAEERDWVEASISWEQAEGAYSELQRTKPQTLAAGLVDSPAALASWMLEKFQAWGDGDATSRIPIDLIVDNASLYWFTRTGGSAARYYYESRVTARRADRVEVRTGFALWPHDIDRGPRSFAERWYRVERFSELPRGGHFGAMEEPRLLADELRAFFAG